MNAIIYFGVNSRIKNKYNFIFTYSFSSKNHVFVEIKMIQTKQDSYTDVTFRRPSGSKWEILQITNEDTAQQGVVQSNNELIKNTLLQSLQMQNIIILAGSGCSIYAGGPSMTDLWNTVSENAAKFADKINYDIEDKNIENFLSHIDAYLSINKGEKELQSILEHTRKNILEKCSQFIKNAKLDAHEILLHRLSRRRSRDSRLKIFTTNYDICFERAAANLGRVAIDGFSFTTPRKYDPRYFDYDIVRRPRSGEDSGNYLEGVFQLYKLHGSVNWEAKDGSVIEKETPDPQKACLIYPARGKYQQSYNQPYIESISQYLSAIREPNTCILVIGFGFNDNHLSEPLVSAVRSNPHLRLIIVDPELKYKTEIDRDMLNDLSYYMDDSMGNRNNFHLESIIDLSQRGDDVWLINESFQDFVKRVPDLKSLTPVERLANAIDHVVRQS